MLPETFASLDSPHVRWLLKLGVFEINSWALRADSAVGKIIIRPEGMGGPVVVPWSDFTRELDALLQTDRLADVWVKLAACSPDDRHLFLGISSTSPWPINWALDFRRPDLPQEAPKLPEQATHLWLMATSPGTRCLAWFPDLGWIDVADHWAIP